MHMHLLRSLLLATSFLAIAPAAMAQPFEYVYRVDSLPPDQVFEHGLHGRGLNLNVLAHALAGSCRDPSATPATSAFVSTTGALQQALRFGEARLRGIGQEGWTETVWIYTIRADSLFLSTGLLVNQVLELANTNQQGYTHAFRNRLNRLMATTGLGSNEEVLATHIEPSNISEARPYSYRDGQLVAGPPYVNPRYEHANTHTSTDIPPNINELIPPLAVEAPVRYASCSFSCDRAAMQRSDSFDQQCKIWSGWMSPAIMRALL